MNTITATNARSHLFQVLKNTIQKHLPTRIISKTGATVLISEEEYESLIETAELLSIPGLKNSIKKADKEIQKGETYSFDEVFA